MVSSAWAHGAHSYLRFVGPVPLSGHPSARAHPRALRSSASPATRAPPPLARVDAHAFPARIDEPARTSFGPRSERVAVFVRVEDSDGARGWGEVWSTFPTASAEHRALLFADIVAPRALGKSLDDPETVDELIEAAKR